MSKNVEGTSGWRRFGIPAGARRAPRSIIALLAAAAVVTVSTSCASTKPVLGFATSAYVDQQLDARATALASDLEETRRQVGRLAAELDEYTATADELTALLDRIDEVIGDYEQTKAATEELQQLAVQVEQRLEELPTETIAQIVEVLQEFLESQPGR